MSRSGDFCAYHRRQTRFAAHALTRGKYYYPEPEPLLSALINCSTYFIMFSNNLPTIVSIHYLLFFFSLVPGPKEEEKGPGSYYSRMRQLLQARFQAARKAQSEREGALCLFVLLGYDYI